MAAIGETLRQGEADTLVFRQTAADTHGALLDVEVVYAPMGRLRPPVHYHPGQDEHFHVLAGELSVFLDGRTVRLTSGDELAVPRGARHAMWNAGDDPVGFRWRTTPALRSEALMETLWGMAERGLSGRHGQPRPALLQSLLLMWTYRREWRLATPPYPIALPLCAALSVPARLLGYRAHYPNLSSGETS